MFRTRLERIIAKILVIVALPTILASAYLYYRRNHTESLREKLAQAVYAGDRRQTAKLLEQGADPNTRIPQNLGRNFGGQIAGSLLDIAIIDRHEDVAECLLQHGAKLNLSRVADIADLPGTSILDYEIKWHGEPQLMLRYACAYGNFAQAKLLNERFPALKKGLKGDSLASIALCRAAKGGMVRPARLLIENGADINEPVFQSMTPLMHAASNGHAEIVKLLLSAGANSHSTIDGLDAKSLARDTGHQEIVKLLSGNMTAPDQTARHD